MEVNIPFRWSLSSQKLKKLNSFYALKKCLGNVMNVKWYIVVSKERNLHGHIKAAIKIIGTNQCKTFDVYTRVFFYRCDSITRIDSEKVCLNNFTFLRSAVRREIRKAKKLIIKGRIKIRSSKCKDISNKENTGADNKPVQSSSSLSCQIPQTFVNGLNVGKKTSNDKCINASIPGKAIHCEVVKLTEDLEAMYNNSYLSDVTIKCQSEYFRAHKAILKARCPALLLEGLKNNPDKTKVMRRINIESLPVHVVKALLFYIYTGKVESMTLYLACDLINAASIYNLKSLKDTCLDFLMNSLNDENVIFVYSFSYSADLSLLNSLALKYISQNFSSISNSQGWEQLKCARPDLSTSILSEVVKLTTTPVIDLTDE